MVGIALLSRMLWLIVYIASLHVGAPTRSNVPSSPTGVLGLIVDVDAERAAHDTELGTQDIAGE